jgi:hypothetical protein
VPLASRAADLAVAAIGVTVSEGTGKSASARSPPTVNGKLILATGVKNRPAMLPQPAAPRFDPAFDIMMAVNGSVNGNPRYHSGETATPMAVNAICAMVRGMAFGSAVAAAITAATGASKEEDVVTAASGAVELLVTALTTAACNNTG